jgi:hypothetical protein
MIARRSLITAALGALGAGASGVRADDILSAGGGVYRGPDDWSNRIEVAHTAEPPAFWSAARPLRDELYKEQHRLERQIKIGRGMPADIAAMRSWSAVVKQGKVEKRLLELDNALRALDEESTALPILRKFGLLP